MANRSASIEVAVGARECCPSVLASPLDASEASELAWASRPWPPGPARVLSILAASPEGEVCVCDFVGPVGKTQPTISITLKS